MTDKNNSARIENILGQVRELKEHHEKRAATGEFFKVFLVPGVKIDEDTHKVSSYSARRAATSFQCRVISDHSRYFLLPFHLRHSHPSPSGH